MTEQEREKSQLEGMFSSGEEDEYEPEMEQEAHETQQLESLRKLDLQNEKKQKVPDGVRLFLGLEDKTEEALATFVNLEDSTYANKQLGSSGQGAGDYMSCACQEEWDGDYNVACCDDDCINRGTKIECVNGYSSCGDDCSNQRFQKKQYARVAVIQTEKKGYGVRAEEDLEPDTFIYEYKGEVIEEKAFKKRMIEYDQLKLKHFYFMMLQKNEFVDATRKGCLARFCNHSCNPNCYVEKWVVGNKLRMGIFSKRRIVRGEEITFNYNVDRYGANAQPCYCGEPNCIGFIGGKTQTEAASLLPQFISEALGSTVEEEQEYLKLRPDAEKASSNGNNVNIEYIKSLVMKPIELFEVNKVMGGLLQCEEPIIADKLIERIELSNDQVIQHKLSYAHGYTSLGKILKSFYSSDKLFDVDDKLILRILNILLKWPKVSKTHIKKVEIIPILQKLIETDGNKTDISKISNELLERYDKFEEYQRIKKTDKVSTEKKFIFDDRRRNRLEQESSSTSSPVKRENSVESATSSNTFIDNKAYGDEPLPTGWESFTTNEGAVYYHHKESGKTTWFRSDFQKPPKLNRYNSGNGSSNGHKKQNVRNDSYRHDNNRHNDNRHDNRYQRSNGDVKKEQSSNQESDLNKIIEEARKAEADKQAKAEEQKRAAELKEFKRQEYKKKLEAKLKAKKAAKAKLEQDRANGIVPPASSTNNSAKGDSSTEKQWARFFAQHIPNMVKKYRDEIGHDNVKLCAKEISKILIEKEQKKDPSKQPPEDLDPAKRKKIKIFIDSYMEKFLNKYRLKQQKRKLEGHNGDGANTKKQDTGL